MRLLRLYMLEVVHREAATGFRVPIVVHQFFGRTRAEAFGYHDAHRKADRFLRECEDGGVFAGAVACTAELHDIGWVDVKDLP